MRVRIFPCEELAGVFTLCLTIREDLPARRATAAAYTRGRARALGAAASLPLHQQTKDKRGPFLDILQVLETCIDVGNAVVPFLGCRSCLSPISLQSPPAP